MQVQHIGSLWARFKRKFPKVETKPPLDPVVEIFDQKFVRPAMRFEVGEMPLFPRVWFVSDSGGELIQVQPDRFIHNWRKTGDATLYPRYERIRDDFERELGLFAEFLKEHSLGDLKPNQCEITYINHIPADGGSPAHGQAHGFLKPLNGDFRVSFLPAPEATRFSTRYVLQQQSAGGEKPFGRLYVDMNPAFNAERKPIFVLNLTVRAVPDGQDVKSAMRCYDVGRKHIVCTFDAITTETMHTAWGKQ